MYSLDVQSIHDMVCRIKTILANRSPVSHVRQDLGDGPLKSTEGPLFQMIKIAVIDVDQLLEPKLSEGLWDQRHRTPSLLLSLLILSWLSYCLCHMLHSSDWSCVQRQFCVHPLRLNPKMKHL